jgi:hypothetical protein
MTGDLGTRKIIMDKRMLLRICNALNAEAASFETQADADSQLLRSARDVLRYTARDNRALTASLLRQWDTA